jgi:hypothetical protein
MNERHITSEDLEARHYGVVEHQKKAFKQRMVERTAELKGLQKHTTRAEWMDGLSYAVYEHPLAFAHSV